MKMLRLILPTVLLAAAPVWADREVNETRTVEPDGRILIKNVAGSVNVTTWDRNEISINGKLEDDVEELAISGDASYTRVEVKIPKRLGWRKRIDADLDVQIPAGSKVAIDAVSADVTIRDRRGDLSVKTVSGDIEIDGSADQLRLHSVSGDIEAQGEWRESEVGSVSGDIDLDGTFGDVQLKSVSGDIKLDGSYESVQGRSVSGEIYVSGISQEVRLSSVSGELDVQADSCSRAEFNSVSGGISFECNQFEKGNLKASTKSGGIRLRLPENISGDFDIETFSGSIHTGLTDHPVHENKYGPGKSLSFTTRDGDVRIDVDAFSGGVRIEH